MRHWHDWSARELNTVVRDDFYRLFGNLGWGPVELEGGMIRVRIDNKVWHVVVRSSRNRNYQFVLKETVMSYPTWAMALAHYLDGQDEPDRFFIPHWAWQDEDIASLTDHDYAGLKSKPEWGINLSKKKYHILNPFRWTGTEFPWITTA